MNQSTRRCSRCGSNLQDRSGQLCPACLFRMGLEQPTVLPHQEEEEALPSVPGYDLVREIGSGATSRVYQAVDVVAGRTVAIKIMRHGLLRTFEASERFRIETTAIGRLQHSAIVPLFEVGEHSGCNYLTMPCYPGGSLADVLNKRTLGLHESATLMIRAAEAVHYAHQHGVLHRDLKPSNLLLDDEGQPHLADFGLAKISDEETSLTLTDHILGTPAYMAPEQASGKARKATVAADIYSLGAILFEMLTGRPVFIGSSALEIIRHAADTEPPSPRTVNPKIDRDLEAICLRALQKAPAQRYPSAAEFAADLRRWLNSEPTLARPPRLLDRSAKWVRRKPVVAALSALSFAIFIAGLIGVLWAWSRANREREAYARENYAASLGLAGQRITEGDIFGARSLLQQQPERFRGWEWNRLMAQSFPDLLHYFPFTNKPTGNLRVPVPWHRISPDGTMLAVWGSGDPKHVVSSRTGRTILVIPNQPNGDAAFSADSRFLIAGGPGEGFTVWDTASWTTLSSFDDASTPDRRLVTHPSERWVLVSTRTNYARIYNYKTGQLLLQFPKSEKSINPHFSKTGSHFWITEDGPLPGRIEIHEAGTGRVVSTLPQLTNVQRYSLIDSKTYVTVGTNGTAAVWQIGNPKPIFETPPYRSARVVWSGFSISENVLAVACEDGRLDFWNVKTGDQSLAHNPGGVYILSVTDELIVTSGRDNFVRFWDWHARLVHQVASGYAANSIAWHATAKGDFFSSAWHLPTGVPVIQLWSRQPLDLQLTPSTPVVTSALSPDGNTLALGDMSGVLTLHDAATGAATAALQGHFRNIMHALWHPDGLRLYSASLDHTIRVWDARARQQIGMITNHTAGVLRLSISSDGQRLAATDNGGWVKVFDARTLKELHSWRPITNLFHWSIALSPNGRQLAVGAAQNQHGVWDTTTGAKLTGLTTFTADQQGNGLLSAAFSPDGRTLATCDYFGNLHFWDSSSWTLLRSTKARGASPAMLFTPDGTRLLLAFSDTPSGVTGNTTLEVHDAGTGRHITSLGSEPGHCSSISFAAGKLARTVVTGVNSLPKVQVWSALSDAAKHQHDPALLEVEARNLAWTRSTSPPSPRHIEISSIEPRGNWAPRSPFTPESCLDLTPVYNAHLETGWEPFYYLWDVDAHLAELPRGVVTLDGVVWDVRGMIVVGKGPSPALETWRIRPESTRLPIHQKIRRFHFLHAFGMGGDEGVIASYQLRFADGTTHSFPLHSKVEIAHWWDGTAWSQASSAKIAWEGTHPRGTRAGLSARLFHWSQDNPHLEKEISEIVFQSESVKATAMLIAISVE